MSKKVMCFLDAHDISYAQEWLRCHLASPLATAMQSIPR